MTNPGVVHRRHPILIGLVLWLAVVSIAGVAGLPQKLVTPAPQLILAVLTIVLLLASAFYPPLRSWVLESDWRALVEIHLVRLIAGAGFLLAGSRGKFPEQFANMAGKGDIAVAIVGLFVILLVAPHKSYAPFVYGLWNLLGLVEILRVVMEASRLDLADHLAMSELLRMPFVLLPLFVVPILVASHIWLFERIFRRWRGSEVD
ncbi:MAG: hypothetical protein ABIZ36_13425 [Gemmatimonadaceae bacterium]